MYDVFGKAGIQVESSGCHHSGDRAVACLGVSGRAGPAGFQKQESKHPKELIATVSFAGSTDEPAASDAGSADAQLEFS